MSGSVPAVGWATTPPTGIGQILQDNFDFDLDIAITQCTAYSVGGVFELGKFTQASGSIDYQIIGT